MAFFKRRSQKAARSNLGRTGKIKKQEVRSKRQEKAKKARSKKQEAKRREEAKNKTPQSCGIAFISVGDLDKEAQFGSKSKDFSLLLCFLLLTSFNRTQETMPVKQIDLAKCSEEELLALRMCDLPLKIEGTWLESCINELYAELDKRGIKFKPTFYLADEWLTPDNEPIIGIPFFLAHPALIKLEKKMVLEAEGETKQWCLRLLRHEMGHAINYAYKLYKRKKWQRIFGKTSLEYQDTYRFRPYSRSFVKHLEDYYAQYHPDEDFAETFAVWLTPGLVWREHYKGWKAFEKLTYVDELLNEIRDMEPFVAKGKKYWHASSLKTTLANYYKKKRRSYAEEFPDFHDSNLKRIFVVKDDEHAKFPAASDILRKHRKNILKSVSRWTGEKKCVVDNLLKTLISRSRELKLVVNEDEPLAAVRISTYVTTLIMNYIYTGRFRGGNEKKSKGSPTV